MKINGKKIKGVKETVGIYNKIPLDSRKSFNILYDNVTSMVMLVRNDFFKNSGMYTERYRDKSGLTLLRYENINDLMMCVYPYSFDYGRKNISMAMLRSVLSQYIV